MGVRVQAFQKVVGQSLLEIAAIQLQNYEHRTVNRRVRFVSGFLVKRLGE